MLRGILIVLLIYQLNERLRPTATTLWSLSSWTPHKLTEPWPLNQLSIEALLTIKRKSVFSALDRCSKNVTLSVIAILLSGDVHQNPGPNNVHNCGICELPVTWTHKVMTCDSCDMWFHHTCVDIGSSEFEALNRPTVAWICPRCDSINCDSFTYRSYELDCSNSFLPLQQMSSIESLTSPVRFAPIHTSSPKISSRFKLNSTNKSNRSASQSPTTKSNNSSLFDVDKKTNLRILNVNCQSISSKKQELEAVLHYVKPDIVCGTESWLRGIKPGRVPTHDHIKSAEVFPDYYNVYRNDRTTIGGGVFIMVHKSLTSSEQPELVTNCEIEWAKVKIKNHKDLFIGSFYMPIRNKYDLDQLQLSINKITENGKLHKNIILAGDFNCPNINWETHTANSNGKDNDIQQSLIDLATASNLTQVQFTPTRGSNILDLVFTSNPTLAKSSVNIPGVSDHEIVVTEFDIKPMITPSQTRKCYKFGKANWGNMKIDLDDAAESIARDQKAGKDVEQLWSTFKKSLLSSINANIPTYIHKNTTSLPWINVKIKRILKKKKRLFKKARATNNWPPYRLFQKQCRRELRKAEWNYINSTIQQGLDNNNSKPFWRFVKARKQDNIGVAPLKENGRLFSDSQNKAAILLKEFKSVYTKSSGKPLPPLSRLCSNIKPLEITVLGVTKLLQELKPNKASGPDCIPNIVLKTLAKNIAPSLTTISRLQLIKVIFQVIGLTPT